MEKPSKGVGSNRKKEVLMETQKKLLHYRIRWNFDPADLFEETSTYEFGDHSLTFGKGVVGIDFPPGYTEEAVMALVETLTKEAKLLLSAAGTFHNRVVSLRGKGVMVKMYSDGSNDGTALLEGVEARAEVGKLDPLCKDAAGNIEYDAKKERKNARLSFLKLLSKNHDDPPLQKMLESFQKALSDPENEFVHLYEIMEIVVTVFGSDSRTILEIPLIPWRKFNGLMNSPSISQGRHRGQHRGDLRKATVEELTFAREFAQKVLEKYARHISAPRRQIATDNE